MATNSARAQALRRAVTDFRDEVAASTLPLDLPSTSDATANREELLNQLDDYVIPRLSSLEAPLLAVVGGSTGAGKSTLVNSIVGQVVSRSGVLRPTTIAPVLVHHPDDEHWFTGKRILPSLARLTGAEPVEGEPGTVRLVRSSSLPPGLALVDAPDIDSVVVANRILAQQLLLAADLWLFVTTAARYADAVPWHVLRAASDRGTAIAIILDRISVEVTDEIRPHLADMLRQQGLSTAPIFTIPESDLDTDGLLPADAMSRLLDWLEALAGDTRARSIIVSQTLSGALASLDGRVAELVAASTEQYSATEVLRDVVRTAFDDAVSGVAAGMTDGSMLRGEVLARWQEFVGTGEFLRNVESKIARWRDRITAMVKGEPAPPESLDDAVHSGVAALVRSNTEGATAAITRSWRSLRAGQLVLAEHPDLTSVSPDLRPTVERMVRDWQGSVLDLVSSEGQDRRTNARVAAYGVNAIGLFLMLVAFAHTGGLVGAEVGIAGGSAVLAQRVLEAIFGDQAVRDMAKKARTDLLGQVRRLCDNEQERYLAAVTSLSVDEHQAARLTAAAEAVKEATP